MRQENSNSVLMSPVPALRLLTKAAGKHDVPRSGFLHPEISFPHSAARRG
jgi:hypothetical protein